VDKKRESIKEGYQDLMEILDELKGMYLQNKSGVFASACDGYWSFLTRQQNSELLDSLQNLTPKQAVRKFRPDLYDYSFSPKRQAGLELLKLKGDEICVDYGCMWGACAIPLAKRTRFVLGVDQTLDSLLFLKARMMEEKVNNISLLCLDLKKMPLFENKFDVAIINGVLEWIPESGPVEAYSSADRLISYFGKHDKKEYDSNPKSLQVAFMKKVCDNLKDGGKCYLAIENRYDFKMFLGQPDPHAGLLFTSFVPRRLADIISLNRVGRPYINWLYSFNEIKMLLKDSGFGKIDMYMAFPDYFLPEKILSYEDSFNNFQLSISPRNSKGEKTLKRQLGRLAEFMFFKLLRARFLAPSIICVAHK
jgi:hypothetical protein